MRSRAEFALAVALDLAGGGVALLISTRHWQSVRVPRTRPLADRTFQLTGRALDNTPTALALVALAGVVAVIAVKGWGRRAVGVVLAAAGVVLAWRSLDLVGAVSASRALAAAPRSGEGVVSGQAHVTSTAIWPALSAACGVLVAVAGGLVAARGHRWVGLSARYDSPTRRPDDDETARARRDASWWQSLDRGDDPTAAESPVTPEAPGRDRPGGSRRPFDG
jgi:uncharacterized membrane protein (TIGR02234 family)